MCILPRQWIPLIMNMDVTGDCIELSTSNRKGSESLREIQGDSGGICNTLENDSMCDSKQKSSYEHGSDF